MTTKPVPRTVFVPSSALDKFFDDAFGRMDRVLQQTFCDPNSSGLLFNLGKAAFPRINAFVDEECEQVIFEAALPGRTRDQVEISFEDGILTISGENLNDEEDKKVYFCHEIPKGKFSRSFSGFDYELYDTDAISATFENGLLRIVIPKKVKLLSEPTKKIILIND